MSACIPSVNKPSPTTGYAMRQIDGVREYEHRRAWREVNGPIPEGLLLDHTCHDPQVCLGGVACPHRRCINPEHLEPVTHAENVRRGRHHQGLKTECPRSHPYSEENTYVDPRGRRHCRTCTRQWIANYKQRKREE